MLQNYGYSVALLLGSFLLTGLAGPANGEPASRKSDERPASRGEIAVRKADPEEDLQTIIDDVSPGTRIIGDPGNRRATEQVEITKNGITLKRFNLKLSDHTDHALLAVHGCRDVTIRNCRLEGRRNESDSGGWTNGITITDAHHVRVIDCSVSDFVLQGITATTNPLHGGIAKKGGRSRIFGSSETGCYGSGTGTFCFPADAGEPPCTVG